MNQQSQHDVLMPKPWLSESSMTFLTTNMDFKSTNGQSFSRLFLLQDETLLHQKTIKAFQNLKTTYFLGYPEQISFFEWDQSQHLDDFRPVTLKSRTWRRLKRNYIQSSVGGLEVVASHNTNISWPPRLPDLIPMDYNLWGNIKKLVYTQNYQDLNQFKDAIVAAFQHIKFQTIRNRLRPNSSKSLHWGPCY